jgi:hypothetical protein
MLFAPTDLTVITPAQAQTIERVLRAGGTAHPHMGRLSKTGTDVRLTVVTRLLDEDLLEGFVNLNRAKSQIFATARGCRALHEYRAHVAAKEYDRLTR